MMTHPFSIDTLEHFILRGDYVHVAPDGATTIAANGSLRHELEAVREERDRYRYEVGELKALLNTPETEDFDKAVPLEAAHQVQRWSSEHDAGKLPMDWFWLVGYLAGKALAAHITGDTFKGKHHCISTAAVLRNWHAHIRSGETVMMPGLAEEKTQAIAPQE